MIQTEYYKTYIRSREWHVKEFQRMMIDDFKCVMCGRTDTQTRHGLQVHHTTYARLGRENIYTDLVTLCGRCHKWLHNYNNRIQTKQKGGII